MAQLGDGKFQMKDFGMEGAGRGVIGVLRQSDQRRLEPSGGITPACAIKSEHISWNYCKSNSDNVTR